MHRTSEALAALASTINIGTPEPEPPPKTAGEQVADALRAAGVPERYHDARFSNWRPTRGTETALKAAKRAPKRKKKLKARVTVTAKDAAANASKSQLSIKLKP